MSKTIKPVSFSSVSRPHRHVGAVLDDCFGGEHGRFLRRLTTEIDCAFLVTKVQQSEGWKAPRRKLHIRPKDTITTMEE